MSRSGEPLSVVAALSGGVDSAVAAARAVDAGHRVTGVHLALAKANGAPATARARRGCCTPEDARDARRVADRLGIPFYVWDLSAEFADDVVDDFVSEYAAGRTPNPCVRCNERIKFAAVLDRARSLGFDAVCTGHYADRRVDAVTGRVSLHRAVDAAKDQSYVLAVLTPEQLRHSLFPLGDSTKGAVRREAAERGLAVSAKPDSHDICFIPDGDTQGFLAARLGSAPGEIVDAATGQVIGEHEGTYRYTVGQRRGIGIQRPDPSGEPRYVVGVDPASNQVLVGVAELLSTRRVDARDVHWLSPDARAAVDGGGATAGVDGASRFALQLRAHGEPMPATVEASGQAFVARLDDPARGVAPGQTAVLYLGDEVVACGTIADPAGHAEPTRPAGDAEHRGAAAPATAGGPAR